MITHIWLKNQPKKKLSYPDCFPTIYTARTTVWINDAIGNIHASYEYESISRIEFRP